MVKESNLGLYGSIASNLRVHEQRHESARLRLVNARQDLDYEQDQVFRCKTILADLDKLWFIQYVQSPCWLFRVY